MSAATAPKPDDGVGDPATADGWALLEGLRRRLDDQAAANRKMQAHVGQLAESIGALVAQQRRRSLWMNVNSFVAYVVFTVLCAAGCFLLYRSRAHELSQTRDHAIAERDAAVRRADEATVRAVARESADTKAWEVYQLLDAGKRAEATAKLDALREAPLSRTERAVLAARVHDTQVMEVDTALKGALAAFKAGRPGDVIKPLEAALSVEPSGARAATIHYYLGVAYARTDLQSAVTHLQAAVAADVDQDDARFQLASVLDRSGAYAAARAEYDRFATAHPQSPFAAFALRRSATLARFPPVAPGARPAGLGAGAPAVRGGAIAPAAGTMPSGAATPGVTTPNSAAAPAVSTPNGAAAPAITTPNGAAAPGARTPNGAAAPGVTTPNGAAAPAGTTPNGAAAPAGTTPNGAAAPAGAATRPGGAGAPGVARPNGGAAAASRAATPFGAAAPTGASATSSGAAAPAGASATPSGAAAPAGASATPGGAAPPPGSSVAPSGAAPLGATTPNGARRTDVVAAATSRAAPAPSTS